MTSESDPEPTKTVGIIKPDKSTLGRTLPVDDVSDSNGSIIQSSTDYNHRKGFPSGNDPEALQAAFAFTKMVAIKAGFTPSKLEAGLVLARESYETWREAVAAGIDPEDAYITIFGREGYDFYVKVRARSPFPSAADKEDLGPARQKLTQSLSEAWGAYQDSPDGGRRGVNIALKAAGDFIAAAHPDAGDMFDKFLAVLMSALGDRSDGITAPLLKHGTEQGRETNSTAYREIQRHAVATMACLMDADYSREEAAKEVTAALTKNGFPTSQRAVKDWYDERLPAKVKPRKGRPRKSAPGLQSEDALFLYIITNRVALSLGPEKRAKILLDELIYFTRLWFPAPRKGAT